MIRIEVQGIKSTIATLSGQGKQVIYAASRTLNTMAFGINADIKTEMNARFKGGATAFTLRAFRIDKASKEKLTAIVALRDDAPDGGSSYEKALHHLFTGGTRDWKKIEGLLRGIGLIPDGLMIVPGAACPLDSRGNMRKAALNEMLGVIKSNVRNIRVFRRTGAGKQQKGVGYFVVMPGDKTNLHIGIWKRIEVGASSTIKPIIMYVHQGKWSKFIDLDHIGNNFVARRWQPVFELELADAMRTAR